MLSKIKLIIFVALMALAGAYTASINKAEAGCVLAERCGIEGPKHYVDPNTLTDLERKNIERNRVVRTTAGNCEFRYFRRNGAPVKNPVVFASSGAAFGCPQEVTSICKKCVAWVNGKNGSVSGPAREIMQSGGGTARTLQKGSTGMWVPKSYRGQLGWCDIGLSVHWSTGSVSYYFAG